MIGGKYNRWILILQEFELNFLSNKSKKSLIFAKLISKLPCGEEIVYEESFPDEHIFLISSQDPGMEILLCISRLGSFPSFFQRMSVENCVTWRKAILS